MRVALPVNEQPKKGSQPRSRLPNTRLDNEVLQFQFSIEITNTASAYLAEIRRMRAIPRT